MMTIMRKKQTNLAQETFDYFPKIEDWPEGYHKYLLPHQMLSSRIFGFDIETEGLNPYDNKRRIKTIAISPKNNVAYSFYNEHNFDRYFESLACLLSLVQEPDVILVGHNCKFDINWISTKFKARVRCMLFDTMMAQYLLDETLKPNDLDSAIKRASIQNLSDWEDLVGYKSEIDRENLDKMNREDLLLYNCRDADASRRLYNYFIPKLKEGGYDKLMATASMVLPILSKMETRGVYLDKEWAYKTQSKLFNDLVKLRYSMCEIAKASFNPDSPQSLSSILYRKLQFTPTSFTSSGQPSTASETLGYLVDQATTEDQNKFLDAIISYKKQMKLLTTYYQPIERWTKYDGRVHPTYSLGRFENEEGSGGTVTGRLTCKEPNVQQIPRGKEHRGMFRATEGFTLLDGDFSQLELRVACFLSQDPRMMDAFLNNLDIHTAVMSELTGIPYDEIDIGRHTDEKIKNDRVAFKEVNFGIFYLMSAKRLQRSLRTKAKIYKSLDECKEYITQWFAKFSKAKEWLDNTKLQAVGYGWVKMPLGQVRRLPDASFDRTKEAAHALSQACNFPVQSMASWICLIGLILLQQYFDTHSELFEGYIIMQVHDSVTAEIRIIKNNLITMESIKVDVKKIMEVETINYLRDVFGIVFNVPLLFDLKICDRWE